MQQDNMLICIYSGSRNYFKNGETKYTRDTLLDEKFSHVNIQSRILCYYPTGLSMELVESRNGLQYFKFVHSKAYQKVQFQFMDAVESFNPQNLVVSKI